jgi:hypothetical protein
LADRLINNSDWENGHRFRSFNFILRLEKCLDSDLHKVAKAITNKLSKIDYLKQITHKDLLCMDLIERARVEKTSIVLAAVREEVADRNRNWHGQHQVVSSDELGVRKFTQQVIVKTRLILRL